MLKLFGRKKSENTILKMFRVVSSEQAFGFDNQLLIDTTLGFLDDTFNAEPMNYHITGPYPNNGWTTKNGFRKAVDRRQYKGICHLIMASDTFFFSFTNWMLNKKLPPKKDYQALIFSANTNLCSYEQMEHFYKSISVAIPPDYAFLFRMPANYLPETESKIKRGLFSYSAAKNEKENLWSQQIEKVDGAFIKDVYPVNFIDNAVFTSSCFQESIALKRIGTIQQSEVGLRRWALSEFEVSKAKEALRGSDLLMKS